MKRIISILLCLCLAVPLAACGESKEYQQQLFAMNTTFTITAYGKKSKAGMNAAASPWADKITVICEDIARFTVRSGFDRIVCNPPYFRDSLRCPDAGRNTARHNDSLSYETLARCSAALLTPDGLLCVVLPFDAVGEFSKTAAVEGLNLYMRTDVVTAPGKQPKRSLLAFSKNSHEPRTDVLAICDSDGKETSDYINLVREFYLKY